MEKIYLLKGTYLLALAAVFEIFVTVFGGSVIGVLMYYGAIAATLVGIGYGIAGFFGKGTSEGEKTNSDE